MRFRYTRVWIGHVGAQITNTYYRYTPCSAYRCLWWLALAATQMVHRTKGCSGCPIRAARYELPDTSSGS